MNQRLPSPKLRTRIAALAAATAATLMTTGATVAENSDKADKAIELAIAVALLTAFSVAVNIARGFPYGNEPVRRKVAAANAKMRSGSLI